ncbi:diguanylate cyclase [Anopheles sinensis]|uniref:Diguanylate cyclase n=1 Tax=Anopheles sinensis TaxID=74873 RepID=A0A084VM71_ANOSI|nr:diguanylate cyclase [Anopheles sinensis]
MVCNKGNTSKARLRILESGPEDGDSPSDRGGVVLEHVSRLKPTTPTFWLDEQTVTDSYSRFSPSYVSRRFSTSLQLAACERVRVSPVPTHRMFTTLPSSPLGPHPARGAGRMG